MLCCSNNVITSRTILLDHRSKHVNYLLFFREAGTFNSHTSTFLFNAVIDFFGNDYESPNLTRRRVYKR